MIKGDFLDYYKCVWGLGVAGNKHPAKQSLHETETRAHTLHSHTVFFYTVIELHTGVLIYSRSLSCGAISKSEDVGTSVKPAASATRNMTVITGAPSLNVTSTVLPPSTSTLTASCKMAERVITLALI